MPLQSEGTSFGRKCGDIFVLTYRYATIPILICCLMYGHSRAVDRAIETTRTPVSRSNAKIVAEQVRREIYSAGKWTYFIVTLALVVFVAERLGRRKLVKLGNEMEWLVENVLHELSHVLSDIRERARRIIRGESDPAESARKIDDACRKERRTIAKYMQLAIGFKSYSESTATDVNLTSAAWGVVKKARSEHRRLDINCGVPAEDIVIRAHLDLIGTILDELVGNAAKYTDKGSVTVNVEDLGRNVRIVVSDTGRGIPKEDIGRIFDRFFRSPSSKDRDGDGLGLALVSEIARDHYKGKLAVKSRVGEGTVISVTLPKGRRKSQQATA